jgi:pimeloyl-ACP methyl ester carboxylesterase
MSFELPPQENDAKKLGEKLQKKSLTERVFSEFQTRKTTIPGSEKSEKAEPTEIKRGEVFRFERGQIYKAYTLLRKEIRDVEKRGEDATSKRELLKQIREKAAIMEQQLDELNRQYYENAQTIDVTTKYGDFGVPVAELDLKKQNESDEEEIPTFFIGGAAVGYHQSAVLSMALALDGRKVFVTTYPEQSSVKRPDNFKELLQKDGLNMEADIVKEIIKKMELKKVNIVAFSMGTAITMKMATDPEFNVINDLTLLEPMGIEDKGFPRIATEFAGGHIATISSSEKNIKGIKQGSDENKGSLGFLIEDGKLLAEKSFEPETLKNIHPQGRFQVWVGTKSHLVDDKVAETLFTETETLRQAENPTASPLEFHKVEGGDHLWPLVGALGLSKMMQQEKTADIVHVNDFENSVMARMLKDISEKE